jgi:FkbM family methyltransferase
MRRVVLAATGPIRIGTHRVWSGPARRRRIVVNGVKPGFVLGTSEQQVQQLLVESLPTGGVFYDVGAHVGFMSLVAAQLVGASGEVYSFEPLPENAAALRQTIRLNRGCHWEVIESAVAATDGHAMFAGDGERGHIGDGGLRVRTVRLDSFAATHPPPSVVKIDVEGGELDVLRGAERLLCDHRPVVVCELHDGLPSLTRHPVAMILRDAGYEVSWLEPIATDTGYWTAHVVGR